MIDDRLIRGVSQVHDSISISSISSLNRVRWRRMAARRNPGELRGASRVKYQAFDEAEVSARGLLKRNR